MTPDDNATAEAGGLIRPGTQRRLWIAFAAALAASVLLEIAVPHPARFGLDGAFAFDGLFAVEVVVVLIFLARLYGYLLGRTDRFYD